MEALNMPDNAVDSAIAKILRINPPVEEQEVEEALTPKNMEQNTNNNLNDIFGGI